MGIVRLMLSVILTLFAVSCFAAEDRMVKIDTRLKWIKRPSND